MYSLFRRILAGPCSYETTVIIFEDFNIIIIYSYHLFYNTISLILIHINSLYQYVFTVYKIFKKPYKRLHAVSIRVPFG